jgi:Cdc6-like AAA superfamily ATPase
MTLQDILAGYLRIQRRSEKASPEVLRKTFVNVGPLILLLSITDNQTLFGRRGTGKTHVLQYLASKRQEEGDLAAYIDLSNLGSSGSIYADTRRSVSERATRLLVDTLLALHDGLLDAVLQDSDKFDLSIFGPLLDYLAKAATRVQVTGNIEEESRIGVASTSSDEVKLGAGLSERLSLGINASMGETRKEEIDVRSKVSGTASYVLHFGEISAAIQALRNSLKVEDSGYCWMSGAISRLIFNPILLT